MKRKSNQQIRRELVDAANRLNEIVEGVTSVRWSFKNSRLKDTEEWCEFYVALNRANERNL